MSLPSGTPRSGVTVAGAIDVAPYNLTRKAFALQNTSDTDMRMSEDNVDASATHGFKIIPNALAYADTNQRISLWCSVAGKPFEATEA